MLRTLVLTASGWWYGVGSQRLWCGSRHLSQAISDPIRLFIKTQSIGGMVEIVNGAPCPTWACRRAPPGDTAPTGRSATVPPLLRRRTPGCPERTARLPSAAKAAACSRLLNSKIMPPGRAAQSSAAASNFSGGYEAAPLVAGASEYEHGGGLSPRDLRAQPLTLSCRRFCLFAIYCARDPCRADPDRVASNLARLSWPSSCAAKRASSPRSTGAPSLGGYE